MWNMQTDSLTVRTQRQRQHQHQQLHQHLHLLLRHVRRRQLQLQLLHRRWIGLQRCVMWRRALQWMPLQAPALAS